MTDIEYYNTYMIGRNFVDSLKITYIFSNIIYDNGDCFVTIIHFNEKIINIRLVTCVNCIKEKRWKLLPSREDKLKRILNECNN